MMNKTKYCVLAVCVIWLGAMPAVIRAAEAPEMLSPLRESIMEGAREGLDQLIPDGIGSTGGSDTTDNTGTTGGTGTAGGSGTTGAESDMFDPEAGTVDPDSDGFVGDAESTDRAESDRDDAMTTDEATGTGSSSSGESEAGNGLMATVITVVIIGAVAALLFALLPRKRNG